MNRALTFGLLILLCCVGAAAAQSAEVQRDRPPNSPEARQAIGQLKSPYCPGLMLEVCPSEPAILLRDSIRVMALEGHDPDDIVEWMLSNHGEEWRAVPRMAGWGVLAWALPPIMLLVGLGVLIGYLRRRSEQRGTDGRPVSADDAGPTPDDQARLDAALAAFEEEDR